jgi:hypothetical protein
VTTADWALVISICSAVVSLAGFVWNVWSKFIYPKPTVRVSFAMVQVLDPDSDDIPTVLSLSATNMGPGEVSLSKALIEHQEHFFSLNASDCFRPWTNTRSIRIRRGDTSELAYRRK